MNIVKCELALVFTRAVVPNRGGIPPQGGIL